MIDQRSTTRAALTVIAGGLAATTTPPISTQATTTPAPMIGYMSMFNTETYEPGGHGPVEITPLPDGSFLVRPSRFGSQVWQD